MTSVKYFLVKKYRFLFILLGGMLLFINSSPVGAQGSLSGGNDGDVVVGVDKINNTIGPSNLASFVKSILDIVLTNGIPVVALSIIYSGFLFVSAQGNQEKLQEAKKALLFTLVGAAVLFGSWVIAQAIGNTIEEIRRAA